MNASAGIEGRYTVASQGQGHIVFHVKQGTPFWQYICKFADVAQARDYASYQNKWGEAPEAVGDPVAPVPEDLAPAAPRMLNDDVHPCTFSPPQTREQKLNCAPEVEVEVIPPRQPKGKWADQEARLRELWQSDMHTDEIAEELGRSVGALWQQVRKLKLGPRPKSSHERRGGQRQPKKVQRRFTDTHELDPESVRWLSEDHDAVVKGRSLFPKSVVSVDDSPRLLVSGKNSRKLGDRVTKGPWAGMPIYTLTLEERATCPKSCPVWRVCYGNGMPLARRHKHGPKLVGQLITELNALQRAHPDGFVIRLHNLGDFYSVDYVKNWQQWFGKYSALRVFGYTAHPHDSEIGRAVSHMIMFAGWDRCAIRFSSTEPGEQRAMTIWRRPEGDRVDEGIVCPAQTGKTECCGTCGLCWAKPARKETIVFVGHGNRDRGPSKTKVETRKPVAPTKPWPSEEKPVLTADAVEGQPAGNVFSRPKKRRCQSCAGFFMAKEAKEFLCGRCLSGWGKA